MLEVWQSMQTCHAGCKAHPYFQSFQRHSTNMVDPIAIHIVEGISPLQCQLSKSLQFAYIWFLTYFKILVRADLAQAAVLADFIAEGDSVLVETDLEASALAKDWASKGG